MLLFTDKRFRLAIIRGVGGTGKTILILLKLIELFRKQLTELDEDKNVNDNQQNTIKQENAENLVSDPNMFLLLAPNPHHLRCKMFLDDNGINTCLISNDPNMITPKQDKNTPLVKIVDLKSFLEEISLFYAEQEKVSDVKTTDEKERGTSSYPDNFAPKTPCKSLWLELMKCMHAIFLWMMSKISWAKGTMI